MTEQKTPARLAIAVALAVGSVALAGGAASAIKLRVADVKEAPAPNFNTAAGRITYR